MVLIFSKVFSIMQNERSSYKIWLYKIDMVRKCIVKKDMVRKDMVRQDRYG